MFGIAVSQGTRQGWPEELTCLWAWTSSRRAETMRMQVPVVQRSSSMRFEEQATPIFGSKTKGEGLIAALQLKGKGIDQLGIDILGRESLINCGWTACTTDAVFLVKPQHHDLFADLPCSAPLLIWTRSSPSWGHTSNARGRRQGRPMSYRRVRQLGMHLRPPSLSPHPQRPPRKISQLVGIELGSLSWAN
ncbi:hypothetical protein V8E53_007584 [Lactarius tabidus]|jgi:hypothetical protein